MKLRYLGVMRMRGKSKTGNDYDFAQLKYAREIEPFNGPTRNVIGHGFESHDLSIHNDAIAAFATAQPFSLVDVILEPNPQNPNQNQVVGIKPAPKSQVA